jgi:hypothetical protein
MVRGFSWNKFYSCEDFIFWVDHYVYF